MSTRMNERVTGRTHWRSFGPCPSPRADARARTIVCSWGERMHFFTVGERALACASGALRAPGISVWEALRAG